MVVADPNSIISMYFFYAALGLWIISYIISYLEPNWTAPKWYRWLKKNHGDIMPYLVRDAREMGRQAWMEQVKTQDGLEQWVAEVRRKYRR